MKKLFTISAMLFITCAASAQSDTEASKQIIDSGFMHKLLEESGILFGLFLVSSFFLTIIKSTLDGRLKNKLIEKGASENIVSQLLQPMKKESKLEPLKWFAILTGIGIGLSLINFTQPMGIHSLAIMCFSIAAGFLGYYFLTRKTEL